MTILALLSLWLAAAQPASTTGGASVPLYVDAQGFDCLVRNIQQVSRTRGDPLLIDLASCPPKVRKRLRSFPSFRRRAVPDEPLRLILLTRAELECIRSYRNRLDRLRERVGGSGYRVSLAICAR